MNRLSPWRFIIAFGIVDLFADFTYEGGRSIIGPFMATFGASAILVGFVTGFGEAVALMFRLVTGPLSDRNPKRRWWLPGIGYIFSVASIPLLAVSGALWQTCVLAISERFGKATRTPARDTMLAAASTHTGRGFAFAVHEAFDQGGALLGPLLVAWMIAISHGYRLAFAVLAIPAVLTLGSLAWVRAAVPNPSKYEESKSSDASKHSSTFKLPARFWLYAAFTAVTLLGFPTWALLAYHLEVRHIMSPVVIPVLYAVSMGVSAVVALGAGKMYDRIGLNGLLLTLPLTVAVPFLSFTSSMAYIWAGTVVWGGVMGIHESTMRAAVADLVPSDRRGTGYGIFTATYGLAWLAGATVIGFLYGRSMWSIAEFVIATQVVAAFAFIPLAFKNRAAQL